MYSVRLNRRLPVFQLLFWRHIVTLDIFVWFTIDLSSVSVLTTWQFIPFHFNACEREKISGLLCDNSFPVSVLSVFQSGFSHVGDSCSCKMAEKSNSYYENRNYEIMIWRDTNNLVPWVSEILGTRLSSWDRDSRNTWPEKTSLWYKISHSVKSCLFSFLV